MGGQGTQERERVHSYPAQNVAAQWPYVSPSHCIHVVPFSLLFFKEVKEVKWGIIITKISLQNLTGEVLSVLIDSF